MFIYIYITQLVQGHQCSNFTLSMIEWEDMGDIWIGPRINPWGLRRGLFLSRRPNESVVEGSFFGGVTPFRFIPAPTLGQAVSRGGVRAAVFPLLPASGLYAAL